MTNMVEKINRKFSKKEETEIRAAMAELWENPSKQTVKIPGKSKRKYPVLDGKPCLNFRPRCPQCKKKTPQYCSDFVAVMGGAMQVINKRGDAEMVKNGSGFLGFHWHTHGPGFANVDIVENTPGGQFDLYFCSTDCLRAFFNDAVDELEQNVEKSRKRDLRRTKAGR